MTLLTTRHRVAQRLRKHLTKQLEKLPKDGSSGIEMAQFEAIDGVLEKCASRDLQLVYAD